MTALHEGARISRADAGVVARGQTVFAVLKAVAPGQATWKQRGLAVLHVLHRRSRSLALGLPWLRGKADINRAQCRRLLSRR